MAIVTSNASGNWSVGATWIGGVKPVDGDSVVITAGHNILMDEDMTAMVTGLLSVTVQGHATTPAMLYWKDGTNGVLKIRSSYNLMGSSGTLKGRVLANASGTFGDETPLSRQYKAVISLNGTSQILAQYLDIRLYCSEPTVKYTRVFGSKYDFTASTGTVDIVNNTIDLGVGVTPPATSTRVAIVAISGAMIPSGLLEDCRYYVRSVSGTKCKLSATDSDINIQALTWPGSGVCSILTGRASGGSGLYVIDDVTQDPHWSIAADYNYAMLCNTLYCYSAGTIDTQLSNLGQIVSSSGIIINHAVDSAQEPAARLYLSSRNVQIRSTGTTSLQMVYYPSASVGYSGVFNCAFIGTNVLTGAGASNSRAFYTGYGIQFNGIASNLYSIDYYTRNTICGPNTIAAGCYIPWANSTGASIRGIIDNAGYAMNTCSVCTVDNLSIHGTIYAIISTQCCRFGPNVKFRACYMAVKDCSNCDFLGDIVSGYVAFANSTCRMYGNLKLNYYGSYYTNDRYFGTIYQYNYFDFVGMGNSVGYNGSWLSANRFDLLPTSQFIPENNLHIMYNYGGEKGRIAAGCPGGNIITEAAPATPPVTLPYAYKVSGTTSTYKTFMDIPLLVEGGKLLRIKIYEKCNSAPNLFGLGPRFQLTVPGDYNFENSTLAMVTKTAQVDGGNDTNWHTIVLEYRPVYDEQIVLRSFCQTNSYYYHWMYTMQNATSVALQFRGV